MSNNVYLMVASLNDEDAINYINEKATLKLKRLTSEDVLGFDSFGMCTRSMCLESINEIIQVFKSAPFTNPEYAILFIDCESEVFCGTVNRLSPTSPLSRSRLGERNDFY